MWPSTSLRPSKKMFSLSEDEKLRELVKKNGLYAWEKIAIQMKTRTARQCKERYIYYLDPNINNEPYTIEEDIKLLNLVKERGTKWASLTDNFDRRSQYSLKNRWMYLQRTLKRIDTKFNIEAATRAIHQMTPPKIKPRPREKGRLNKEDSSSESTSYDSSLEQTPTTTPETISVVKPITQQPQIIPIEPPKQQKQEEIPPDFAVDEDIYMSPQTDYTNYGDYDFDRFF